MKLTLLEMTQLILSDMNGAEVNSISDNTESLQVANAIKETYIDIISRADLPEHFSFFEVEASGDASLPCVMYLPSTVLKIDYLKYDKDDGTSSYRTPQYEKINFLDFDTFVDRMYSLDPDESTVDSGTLTISSDTIPLIWENDKAPDYYTTYDDYTLIFDSYNSDVDATLQKNKTVCYGQKEPTFTLSDSFTPDLDSKQFSLLLQESKAQAFADLKQVTNSKAENRARKGWINMQRSKVAFPVNYYDEYPNYGRK